MDRRWRLPIVISCLINIGLLIILGVLGKLQVYTDNKPDVVEVRLVDEGKGDSGKSIGGPAITKPQIEKVTIPPPISSVEEANAILEQVSAYPSNPIPQKKSNDTIADTNSAANIGGDSIGSSSGVDAGQGEGTGSGEGSGDNIGDGTMGNDDGVIVDKGSLTLVNDVEASYPPKMLRQGKTGSVTVQLLVEKDGTVSSVDIIDSTGGSEFEEAVRKVAYQWTFVPATQNGKPVRAYARRTYTFSL